MRTTIRLILFVRFFPDLDHNLVVNDLRQLLHDVAKNAKLELMRGNDLVVKEFLEALIEPDLEVVQDA